MTQVVPRSKLLVGSRVKPKTLQLYTEAVEEFEQWATSTSLSRNTHRQVDEAIRFFIHELCEDQGCLTEGSYLIYGWIFLRPNLHLAERLQLPFSKQAIKGLKAFNIFASWSRSLAVGLDCPSMLCVRSPRDCCSYLGTR